MSEYKISTKGLDEIKRSEKLELKAYQDTGKVWTIGYGHTGKDVKPGMVITKEQAEKLLYQDVSRFENAVRKGVKVPLSQNQFDALVSFSYNVGDRNFANSTLLRRLNQGDYQAAADQLLVWNKDNGKFIQGLLNRRERERALFLGTEYDEKKPTNIPVPTSVDEPIDAPIKKQPNDLSALAQQFTAPTPSETTQGEPTQPEPLTTFTEQFNALNDTLADYTEPQVQKPNYRKQYQNQLAAAFGVTPEMQGGLPDYIGDLVRSIYDQTA